MASKTQHIVICLTVLFVSFMVACNYKDKKAECAVYKKWQRNNLNVRTFRNGDSIPYVEDSALWAVADYPACCAYNNHLPNADTFGLLYNWYAVSDKRGICPNGWRVATAQDWDTLVKAYGGDTIAGKHLKGTSHWLPSQFQGDNASSLNFLPGGNRRDDGGFNGMGSSAPLWTSSEVDSANAVARFMNTKHYRVGIKTGNKKNALGCRCVQINDNQTK